MSGTKVLKLNYHPETMAAVSLGKNTLSLSAGNKSGITITESGVVVNLNPSSKFMVASASINKCGFYEDTPFPFCLVPAVPSQVPSVPIGMQNIQSIAQISAVSLAMAKAFSSLLGA